MAVYQIYPREKKKNILSKLSLTWKLVILNVILFVAFLVIDKLTSINFISEHIALDPFYVLKGARLWTLVTSMFMHGGIFHLFVNMLSLVFIGALLEKILGKKRYLGFYLVSGIIAGLFFVLFYFIAGNLNLHVAAVGASGALFGLIGVLIFLTPNLPVYMMFIPIPIKMKYAAPGLLVILWLISWVGNISIGNTAHLGGLIAGVVYGLYLRKKFPNKIKYLNRRFS